MSPVPSGLAEVKPHKSQDQAASALRGVVARDGKLRLRHFARVSGSEREGGLSVSCTRQAGRSWLCCAAPALHCTPTCASHWLNSAAPRPYSMSNVAETNPVMYCLPPLPPEQVHQLGSGDVGLVDLVQLVGSSHRFALKSLEKKEMLERNKVGVKRGISLKLMYI